MCFIYRIYCHKTLRSQSRLQQCVLNKPLDRKPLKTASRKLAIVLNSVATEPLRRLRPWPHHFLWLKLIIHYLHGKVSEKRDLACIIKKHNKNVLRLKCYNFRRVNAIVFLFSALHITPFLYGKILFGILHLLLASIATFDTPPGSNPP